MALAYLRYEEQNIQAHAFWADIGSNKFYAFRIGKDKQVQKGLEQVDEVVFESQIFENQSAGNFFQSGFRLEIPADLFRNSAQYIQLLSYQNREGKSPAISKAIKIHQATDSLLPNDILKKSYVMSTSIHSNNKQECRSVSFSFEESKFSSAMFWGAILQGVKQIAPVVLPKLLDWLSNNKPGEESKDGKESNNQQLADIIQAVVAVLNKNGAEKKADVVEGKSYSGAFSFSKPRMHSPGFSFRKINQAAPGKMPGYSAPQALPLALIPLIASALPEIMKKAPDILNAVGDSGAKLLNAINGNQLEVQKEENAFVAGLFAEMNKQAMMENLMAHLKNQAEAGQAKSEITPVSSMPGLSVGTSLTSTAPFKIEFKKDSPVAVNGKNKYVYLRNRNIVLWLLVASPDGNPPPRPIPHAIVRLQVKDLLTGRLLLEKRYKYQGVQLNAQLELSIAQDELSILPLNTDLAISAVFSWMARNGQPRNSEPALYPVYLINGAFLKGIGNAIGEPIPLKDPTRFRHFWHKVWEGGSNGARRWEINFDSKYYSYYKYGAETNGRIETKIKADAPESGSDSRYMVTGKLKSGLEITPAALNALLPDISPYPGLSPDELLALKSDDMSRLQNQVATYRIQMRGKKEDKGIIWIYTEIAIHQIFIQNATQVNEYGQVLETKEEEKYFPKISHIHFLGVKPTHNDTESGEDDRVKIDGFDTVFDDKTAFMPIELEPVKNA